MSFGHKCHTSCLPCAPRPWRPPASRHVWTSYSNFTRGSDFFWILFVFFSRNLCCFPVWGGVPFIFLVFPLVSVTTIHSFLGVKPNDQTNSWLRKRRSDGPRQESHQPQPYQDSTTGGEDRSFGDRRNVVDWAA